MSLERATSIADLRELARRRVPRAIFEYADRGSYDEITLRRNRADLDAIELRQRVMIDLSKLSLATTVLGRPVEFARGYRADRTDRAVPSRRRDSRRPRGGVCRRAVRIEHACRSAPSRTCARR